MGRQVEYSRYMTEHWLELIVEIDTEEKYNEVVNFCNDSLSGRWAVNGQYQVNRWTQKYTFIIRDRANDLALFIMKWNAEIIDRHKARVL